ncbi:hypothetical protein PAF17_16520 [Paracoccus sp. Z330]|uniref:Uncharacterized protein n=1 Tax=Paracoccus onchidii TaxID=3017813 RepID=A0ABT4ZIJ0_9RHOB|nr:hypothetical protein [Paracoccus onchidii]MDB6179097.1 hypothetical protein [Paracoccus onchidii]
MLDFKLLIDGQERAGSSDQWQEVIDPANGGVIGRVAHATRDDLNLR